jgi:hypothetical protein
MTQLAMTKASFRITEHHGDKARNFIVTPVETSSDRETVPNKVKAL